MTEPAEQSCPDVAAGLALWAVAVEQGCAEPLLRDPAAAGWWAEVGHPQPAAGDAVATRVAVCVRASVVDGWVRAWIRREPDGVVVELGAGLGTRRLRLGLSAEQHLAVDLPAVVDVRRRLDARERSLRLDVTSPSAVLEITHALGGRPACFVAEGLFPFLPPGSVCGLVRSLVTAHPGAMLCFDAYRPMAAPLLRFHDALPSPRGGLRPTPLRSLALNVIERRHVGDTPAARRRLPLRYRLLRLGWLHRIYRAELARPG